jgi:hypothetical protein
MAHDGQGLVWAPPYILVDDQRFGPVGEELGEVDLHNGAIRIEIAGHFVEHIVLRDRVQRQLPPQSRHLFALVPQCDLFVQEFAARPAIDLALIA